MTYSIITINYNNALGLERTIQSVISQTYKSYEFIIIDGASTDDSVEIIKKYSDKIDYWISEPDKGIYNAMNKGISKASGDYLNFMNSGDCFYNENVLFNIKPYLSDDIIVGNSLCEGTIISNKDDITMMDLYNGSIQHQSSFISRKLFNNLYYDETLKIVSDWKFFIIQLIFNNCSYKSIDKIVAIYDNTGISSTNSTLLHEEREKVLNDLLPPKIACDYKKYHDKESPILEYIPILNKTYRIQIFILYIIKKILSLKKIFE